MRRVLIVTYPFFPFYHVGVKRVAKLCKYLPRFGWEPIVLTKDWDRDLAPEDAFFPPFREPERQRDIGFDLEVRRAAYASRDNRALRWHRRLQAVPARSPLALRVAAAAARKALSLAYPLFGDFPDRYAGWLPAAAAEGAAAVRDRDVAAIVSICPPVSAHVAASRIASATGIPWVAMFDDLFGFHVGPRGPHGSTFRRRQALAHHRRWLRRAAGVTAITPAMLSYLKDVYGQDGELVAVGFDPDEGTRAVGLAGAQVPARPRMRIVYTGSVYLADYRPQLFFEAVDRLCLQAPRWADRLEVCFAGTRCDAELRDMVKGRPAERVYRFVERLSAADAIELQRSADALLLFNVTNAAAASGTLSFPAKTWEYLDAGRPIVAVPSDVGRFGDEVLARTRAGVALSSVEEIVELLDRWLNEWARTGTVPYGGDRNVIAEYGQPRQVGTLARLLDRVTSDRRTAGGRIA